MDGPNLSQYFTNDPPSPFDIIGGKEHVYLLIEINNTNFPNKLAASSLASEALPRTSGPESYVASSTLRSASDNNSGESVADSVKDCWEPAIVEHGIPPILTMPGVELAAELVS